MTENTPVLDSLAARKAVSLTKGAVEAREHILARPAALVPVGAPGASYLLKAGATAEMGATLEDVQGVPIAVAPIVGTPRDLGGCGWHHQSRRFRSSRGGGRIAAMIAEGTESAAS